MFCKISAVKSFQKIHKKAPSKEPFSSTVASCRHFRVAFFRKPRGNKKKLKIFPKSISFSPVPFNYEYCAFLFPFNALSSFSRYDKCSFISRILPHRGLNCVWTLVLILGLQIFVEREVFHSLHKKGPFASYLSVFSSNAAKYRSEKIRIRTLLTLWFRWRFCKRRHLICIKGLVRNLQINQY